MVVLFKFHICSIFEGKRTARGKKFSVVKENRQDAKDAEKTLFAMEGDGIYIFCHSRGNGNPVN